MSEDFFLTNGLLGGHEPESSESGNSGGDDNGPVGCGVVIALVIVIFLLVRCLV